MVTLPYLEGDWRAFDPRSPNADFENGFQDVLVRHTFEDTKRKPKRLEVNGRKGRRATRPQHGHRVTAATSYVPVKPDHFHQRSSMNLTRIVVAEAL